MLSVLKEIMADNNLGAETPGFSLLIARGGQTVTLCNSGFQNPEKKPIDETSNFRLASVTKHFTAVCILQLIENGALTLETTLCALFPEFPAYGRNIAVKNLLIHNSGIREYDDDLDKITTPQISDAQALWIAAQQKDTVFPTGSQYEYSNSAYCILAQIVEKLSGMDFGDYLQKRVFQPAGMKTARLNTAGEIPNRAYGFSKDQHDGWVLKDQNKTSATAGDGGIYASTAELALWQKALYTTENIISRPSRDLMTTPHIARPTGGEFYGFGIVIDTIAGQRCYHHAGESVGFRNGLFYFPDGDITIALLSNQDSVDMLQAGKALIRQDLKQVSMEGVQPSPNPY